MVLCDSSLFIFECYNVYLLVYGITFNNVTLSFHPCQLTQIPGSPCNSTFQLSKETPSVSLTNFNLNTLVNQTAF